MEASAKAGPIAARQLGRFRLGRGRLLILGFSVASLALLSVWIWRVRGLGGLPDVGDPFDVAEALRPIEISDEDNAYVAYSEARRLLTRVTDTVRQFKWVKVTWSTAGPEMQAYLEANRPALDAWRAGTKRPDALYHQPGKMAFDTILPVVQDLRTFERLAELEASRLEEIGAMAESWNWYKSILRCSRHVGRHGVIIERLVGAAIFDTSSRRIVHWAEGPRVDAPMLRLALADVLEADALTVPLSDSIKLEYLICVRDLDELRVLVDEIPMPGGQNGWLEKVAVSTGTKSHLQRARLRMTNDVERSRRVVRLLFANWLPQLDRPARERSPIAIQKPTVIYASDPNAPSAASAIAPKDLDIAIGDTLFAQHFLRPPDRFPQGAAPWSGWAWEGDSNLAREPRRRATLIVKLAAELYRREHGKAPPNAGALLGSDLKKLPDGFKPDDPIPAGID
jgi:hypothetical protein